jgi:hypothetical protein
MAEFDGRPITKTVFYLPPPPTIQPDDFAAALANPVSATSHEGVYYEIDRPPLPPQNEDQRRKNVTLHFFRRDRVDDDVLRVCYGEVSTEEDYRGWVCAAKTQIKCLAILSYS